MKEKIRFLSIFLFRTKRKKLIRVVVMFDRLFCIFVNFKSNSGKESLEFIPWLSPCQSCKLICGPQRNRIRVLPRKHRLALTAPSKSTQGHKDPSLLVSKWNRQFVSRYHDINNLNFLQQINFSFYVSQNPLKESYKQIVN